MTPAIRIRIRQAELAIARLRFDYIDWLSREHADGKHVLPPMQGREFIRDHGIAAQEVLIAEARLQEATEHGHTVERGLQRGREQAGYSAPLPEATEDASSPVPSAEEEATTG